MTNLAFDARPFAEHVPDVGPDPEHKNPGSVEKGAGMIEVGFYVGDNRIVLSSLKAGAYTDLFEKGDPTTGRAAESSSSSTSSTSSQQPADDERYAALEQRIAELEQRPPAEAEQQPPAE